MVFGLAILSVFTRDSASGGHFTSVFTIKSLNRVEKRVWKHGSSKALVLGCPEPRRMIDGGGRDALESTS